MPILTRKTTITLLVLIAGCLLITTVVLLRPKPEPNPPKQPPIPEVSVFVTQPVDQRLTIHTQGTVLPKREIDLVAQVAGKVVSVAPQYADGGFFEADAALVQIEAADYRFMVTRAEAQVAKAREQLALERGRARQAKREWRDLGDSNANALFLRAPQIAAAEAALASAQADLDKALLDLKRTTISAPFRGRIRDTLVDLGQYVGPGTKIAKVYSTDVVEIRLPLTDRQAALVELPVSFENAVSGWQPPVALSATVGSNSHSWQGNIVRTEATIDLQSRMVMAVAEVQNPFVADALTQRPPLAIGTFVQADILGRQLADASEIPLSALYKGAQVLVLDDQDRIYFQPVGVLQSKRDTAIVSGLAPGSRVAGSRIALPIDGMQVKASDRASSANLTGNTEEASQ